MTTPNPPTVPRWLIDAAQHTNAFGTAVGFAAAGYVAGWEDARRGRGSRPSGTGWPTAAAAPDGPRREQARHAAERDVIETAKALAAAARNSAAPRTPVFRAFLDAVANLIDLTDATPTGGQNGDGRG